MPRCGIFCRISNDASSQPGKISAQHTKIIRICVVPAGQFSARSLLLCAFSAPVALVLTWWFRRRPPPWRREVVLKIVCGLLGITGVGLIGPAVARMWG